MIVGTTSSLTWGSSAEMRSAAGTDIATTTLVQPFDHPFSHSNPRVRSFGKPAADWGCSALAARSPRAHVRMVISPELVSTTQKLYFLHSDTKEGREWFNVALATPRSHRDEGSFTCTPYVSEFPHRFFLGT